MKKLAGIVTQLATARARADRGAAPDGGDRLRDIEAFGSNPGNLRARTYTPDTLTAGAALVVVLHGCTQNAAGYDLGAGWSRLAEDHGFALLFPEQRRANNPNCCFNWFSAADTGRGKGEALSIRQMIETVVTTNALDRSRVFVTGLSAGGAMASVMLATYPELFAGGAIIAGLPYGTAVGVPQALERMRGKGLPDPAALGALVRGASDHKGPWPAISVWQGTADTTVSPANADAIVAQWAAVHRIDRAPSRVDLSDGHSLKTWRDADGRAAIEQYSIEGMGHGTPLATNGEEGCGTPGPFMLDVGISSSRRIAAGWGLLSPAGKVASNVAGAVPPIGEGAPGVPALRIRRPERMLGQAAPGPPPGHGVGKVIEDALRAAGLMR